MAAPFIVGPSMREQLYLFTGLLRMTDKVRVEESEEVSFFELNDRDVLVYTRVLRGRRFAFESRVRRRDVLEVRPCAAGREGDFAGIELLARPDSVEQVQFMADRNGEVDKGFSQARSDRLNFLVPLKTRDAASVLLEHIVSAPASEWFAELPSLWEDCRR